MYVPTLQSANILDILGNGISSPGNITSEPEKSSGVDDLLDLLGDLGPISSPTNSGKDIFRGIVLLKCVSSIFWSVRSVGLTAADYVTWDILTNGPPLYRDSLVIRDVDFLNLSGVTMTYRTVDLHI